MEALLFTGHSGAGKTTICRSASEQLQARHLVEREISRTLAREQGFERSRLWVASIVLCQAATEIRNRTADLVSDLPEYATVIINGVYDRLAPESIQQQVGRCTLHLIAVTAPRELRIVRCAQRMKVDLGTAEREMDVLDTFKREVGGEELINRAVLTIENNADVTQAHETMQPYLNKYFSL